MKKIRRTLLIFLLLLLAGGGFYFSHRKGNTTPISAQEIHLNTLVTVTLYGTDRTELLDGPSPSAITTKNSSAARCWKAKFTG